MNVQEPKIECIDVALGTLLMPYVLRTLSLQDMESFEDHLLQCSACREEYERTSIISAALADNREEIVRRLQETGHDFESQYAPYELGSVQVEQMVPAPSTDEHRPTSFIHQWSFRLAAAAVFIGAVWLGIAYYQQQPSRMAQNTPRPVPQNERVAPGNGTTEQSNPLTDKDRGGTPTPAPQSNLAFLATKAKLPFAITTVRGDDESAGAEFEQAMQDYLKDNFKSAQQQLLKLSEADPLKNEIWLYLGISAYMNDDLDLAERSLYRSIKLKPRITRLEQSRWYLANVELKRGQPVPVRRLLTSIITDNAVYVEEAKDLMKRLDQASPPK
jgi:hypothetical protein